MHKILIVDDDPTLVDFLKLLLESEGYETFEASDGEIALTQIKQVNPEVVLLDYMMPNMDGLDVLKHVSSDYDTSFVVMLTGKGSEEVAVECMRAGAVDYVVKPFDNDRLLSVIRNAVRFRESELQRRQMHGEVQDLNRRLQDYVSELEKNSKEWQERKTSIETLLTTIGSLLQKLKQSNPSGEIAELDSLVVKARGILGSH